jgi:MFS family permease
VYTFGAFFDAMVTEFSAGKGATALVFGLTLLMFFGFGAISGPLTDRYGPRPLAMTGAVLLAAGLWMTSQVSTVTMGYLTYGLGVGIGGGLIITPMFVSAGGWFLKRRAIALGVVAAGNGIGTLTLVPLAERLIADNGWRSAYQTLAVIDLILLGAAALVVAKPPIPAAPPAIAAMIRVSRNPTFQRFVITGLLFSVALFIAFGFVVDFATGAGVSSPRAALLVGIIGASSVVGRLGLTAFASKVPAVRILQWCLAAQPVAFGLWLVAGGNYPLLIAFAVLLGISYGGFVALGPVVAALLFGAVGLGGIMGLQFLGVGVGGLIGPPLAGVLADYSSGSSMPILLALSVAVVAFVIALKLPLGAVILPENTPSPPRRDEAD